MDGEKGEGLAAAEGVSFGRVFWPFSGEPDFLNRFLPSRVFVLIELLIVVHALFTVLVDEPEFELIKVVGAKAEFAGRLLATTFFTKIGRAHV